MRIIRRSSLSGKDHAMDLHVSKEQLAAYAAGAFVQDAFPQLNAAEREFILTGITPKEWAEVFGEDDDV